MNKNQFISLRFNCRGERKKKIDITQVIIVDSSTVNIRKPETAMKVSVSERVGTNNVENAIV